MVLIELKMVSGSSTLFRKRDVLATFVRGLPPRPFCCPYCGTRIKYESVGRMDRDNWPAHVKWLPKNLYHGTHCLEAIMQEIPKQGATYAHGIYTDAHGNAISDPDPIGPPGEWITVGGTKVSTGRKKARCVDNYEEY
ncbi:hypothetical protein MHPYR_530044 [uncultured Mycobacterium sp.]|uniref:Uncharacterized protein n=1 Tax=uncultured Mycobacterium sp. TaxID=171292 RepID=A0A1Y5PHQ5_9MYCO|nr:hypothetical protein MHPYR_530044 [uncultured Mycobacterium sp.]